jgi:hypothetical protein
MAERFKAPVLKTGEGSNLPWVRIPLSPPEKKKAPDFRGFFVWICIPSANLPMTQLRLFLFALHEIGHRALIRAGSLCSADSFLVFLVHDVF